MNGPPHRFRQVVLQLQAIWRWLVEREELPSSNRDHSSSPRAWRALGWLLSRERLRGAEQTDRVEEHSFLRWVVASETLPRGLPESEFTKQKTLRWLLEAEHLPQPSRPTPSKTLLGHLFARESLPLSKANDSTMEVVQDEP